MSDKTADRNESDGPFTDENPQLGDLPELRTTVKPPAEWIAAAREDYRRRKAFEETQDVKFPLGERTEREHIETMLIECVWIDLELPGVPVE